MIRCKLTFRGYAPEYLQRFEKAFIEHQFTNIENLKKISAKHFDAHYNDILGERDEIQYAYEMKSVTDDLKQHRLCATLAEITHVLNEIQKEYKSNAGFFNKLDKTATVHFTLHEKNVYPENFSYTSKCTSST
uniref:Uncharacterized protein n=1 Tax=Panagrolaimus davidi TaxID=227884 RepID=A0A914PEG5_9BILA